MGILSFLGDILTLGANSQNVKATNDANVQAVRELNAGNMELAKYNNEYNKQMWDLQNQYNSPAQQMARYSEAGLNPLLIYGESGNSGNAGPVPQAVMPTLQAPQIQSYQMPSIGDALRNSEILDYQKQLLSSQADKNISEADRNNQLTPFEKDFKASMVQLQNTQKSLNEFSLQLQQDLRDIKIQFEKGQLKGQELDIATKKIANNTAQIVNQVGLPLQMEALRLGNAKLSKDIAKANYEMRLMSSQAGYFDAQSAIIELEKTLKKFETKYYFNQNKVQYQKFQFDRNLQSRQFSQQFKLKDIDQEFQKDMQTRQFFFNVGEDYIKTNLDILKNYMTVGPDIFRNVGGSFGKSLYK